MLGDKDEESKNK